MSSESATNATPPDSKPYADSSQAREWDERESARSKPAAGKTREQLHRIALQSNEDLNARREVEKTKAGQRLKTALSQLESFFGNNKAP